MTFKNIPETSLPTSWLFYDATCPLCTAAARRFAPALTCRGIRLEPLQSDRARTLITDTTDEMKLVLPVCKVAGTLRVPSANMANTLRVPLPQHPRPPADPVPLLILGGAEAIAYLARHIWWATPLAWLWLLPPLRPLFRRLYAHVAAHRHCNGAQCQVPYPANGRPS